MRGLPARLAFSIKLRMVLVFLVLAAALMVVFIGAMRQVVATRWQLAAQPLLVDYVDRLAEEITVDGHPSVERARALVQRLPVTVRIEGPVIRWASHPQEPRHDWGHEGDGVREGWPSWDGPMSGTERHDERGTGHHSARVGDGRGWADEPPGWQQIRQITERSTPDGHQLVFGIDRHAMLARHDGSDPLARGLTALLLLTLLAWWYVRRTLRPLDAISAGARRFGQGNFDDPIPASWTRRHGELGELATTLNTMGEDIRQMLDAKRSLLLAISHEMRSPLTRARLHTELLSEDDPDVQPQREALLRDLREMSALVEDLLESERLSDRHVALQRESLDLAVVARGVIAELQKRHPGVQVALHVLPELPPQWLDATRLRLLLRNLLENAVRHGGGGHDSDKKGAFGSTMPDEGGIATTNTAAGPGHTVAPDMDAIAMVRIDRIPTGGCVIEVRDWGPGVPEEQLSKLAEPFHRPDAARSRHAGGVGLGLYLCRLVAQAHGGRLTLENAHPGLRVRAWLPPDPDARESQ
ncbi:sensor histidine kinase [Lautropia dentalis]|uniref:sensor histidine kinase n=1 Tax=Lautropia dentalis TaxID=2490857 RepID=UPI00193A299C|nr:HAMP domain-containing sensor histidine kinase [Lautropia dentalis]